MSHRHPDVGDHLYLSSPGGTVLDTCLSLCVVNTYAPCLPAGFLPPFDAITSLELAPVASFRGAMEEAPMAENLNVLNDSSPTNGWQKTRGASTGYRENDHSRRLPTMNVTYKDEIS